MKSVLAAFLLLLAGIFQPAFAEKRLALVIGNSDYNTFRDLPAAANDAADISTALEDLGFEVTGGEDLDRVDMISEINEFVQQSLDADVAMVYYAGHGLQVDGNNFLVPTDAAIKTIGDLTASTVNLDEIMRALTDSKAIRLIFIDACRNNPLPEDVEQGRLPGLAPIENAEGFLVAYSTQPGNIALDGAGRNSPFAEALLSHIGQVGQNIASLMIAVRKDVIASTGGFQIPWESSSLTREFYFKSGDKDYNSDEALLFRLAGKDRDPAIMEAYLARYPKGAYVTDIRSMTADPAAQAGTADSGDLLWKLAREQRAKALIDIYLERFPNGTHRDEAKELQATLQREEKQGTPPAVLCETLTTHPNDATANVAGVSIQELVSNADRAVEACSVAITQYPEAPHYTALYARALAASGNMKQAITEYQSAADRGDLRALVSLGLMKQVGDGLSRDAEGAAALFEKAANGGSVDGAINLAVMLADGKQIQKNVPKAIKILKTAADQGSAVANYNLGALANRGAEGISGQAIDYFRRATELGYRRAFLQVAVLLDEGRVTKQDPAAAADALLRGVASDNGETLERVFNEAQGWTPDTLRQMQQQLKTAGYYDGQIDGRIGPGVRKALQQWRLQGPPAG